MRKPPEKPGRFTFDSDREGPERLYRKKIDSGPGSVEELPTGIDGRHLASSWSPDGRGLALVADGDILVHSLEDSIRPFLSTRYWETHPEFSPDGRWLVYASDESGQEEVYVRPYPGPGRAVQVSTRGGSKPAWSRDGREIFYRHADAPYKPHAFYAVRLVVEDDHLTPGQPEKLIEGIYRWGSPCRSYDVGPDGRFLLIKNPEESTLSAAIEELFPTRIQVVQNWFAELQEKLPADKKEEPPRGVVTAGATGMMGGRFVSTRLQYWGRLQGTRISKRPKHLAPYPLLPQPLTPPPPPGSNPAPATKSKPPGANGFRGFLF